MQILCERLLINGLQKTTAKLTVDLHRRSDDCVRPRIFLKRVLYRHLLMVPFCSLNLLICEICVICG